jgi:hypothetical protein
MFGSDTPAGSARRGIDAILAADFLTAEQKADILCGNAIAILAASRSGVSSRSVKHARPASNHRHITERLTMPNG